MATWSIKERPMTREEYVRAYALEHNHSDEWAYALGTIEDKGQTILIALPCGCWDSECPGWTMVTPDLVNAHLEAFAPKKLREVFHETMRDKKRSGAR
jgi:hypothetical protein